VDLSCIQDDLLIDVVCILMADIKPWLKTGTLWAISDNEPHYGSKGLFYIVSYVS
jgi:hypothetical protein